MSNATAQLVTAYAETGDSTDLDTIGASAYHDAGEWAHYAASDILGD